MNQVAYLLLNAIPTYPNNSLSWTRHRRVRRNTAAAEVQIPRRGWVKWHNDWCLGRWKWLADFAARKWWHLIVFTLWPPAMSTKPASFLSISWCFLLKHEVSIAIPLLEEKRRVSQHSWKLTFLLGTPRSFPQSDFVGVIDHYQPLWMWQVEKGSATDTRRAPVLGTRDSRGRRTIRSNLAWNKYAYECMWCIYIYIYE